MKTPSRASAWDDEEAGTHGRFSNAETRVGGGGGRRDWTHLDVVVHDRGVTPAVTARAVPPSGAPTRSGSAHHAGGGKVCFRGGEEKRGRVFFLDACTAAVGDL